MTVAINKTKKCKIFYLTGNKIVKLMRKAIRKVCLDTTPEKLKNDSANLLHDWACILLDEAGKSPQYIKKRLHWLGESFRMYLRDTAIIQHQHLDVLKAALQEAIDVIAALLYDVIALCSIMNISDDPSMP
jgi:hypothetical protein